MANAKYDWEKWTDGEVHEAVEGEDYTCRKASFVTVLRHKAGELYTSVSIENQRGYELRFRFGDQPDFPRRLPKPMRKPGSKPMGDRPFRWYKGEKVYDDG